MAYIIKRKLTPSYIKSIASGEIERTWAKWKAFVFGTEKEANEALWKICGCLTECESYEVVSLHPATTQGLLFEEPITQKRELLKNW